jgi:hypothetical protein
MTSAGFRSERTSVTRAPMGPAPLTSTLRPARSPARDTLKCHAEGLCEDGPIEGQTIGQVHQLRGSDHQTLPESALYVGHPCCASEEHHVCVQVRASDRAVAARPARPAGVHGNSLSGPDSRHACPDSGYDARSLVAKDMGSRTT